MVGLKQAPDRFRQFTDHFLFPAEKTFFKLRQQNEKNSDNVKQNGEQRRQGYAERGLVGELSYRFFRHGGTCLQNPGKIAKYSFLKYVSSTSDKQCLPTS